MLGPGCRLIQARVGEVLANQPELLHGVTHVFHLAAAVGVKLVVDDPIGMIRTNIEETTRVLDAARDAGAAVLVASSSEVYGKGVKMPARRGR